MAKKKKSVVEIDDFSFAIKEVLRVDGVVDGNEAALTDPVANETGSLNLDYDLITPCPEGRMVEIYGSEGSGKTTICLEIIGQALTKGKKCVFWNLERALNASLVRSIRTLKPFIGNENFQIFKSDNGEAALNGARKFAELTPNSIIVMDSVDSLVPEAVLSGEIGEQKMGNLSKLMSDAMRKLIGVVESNKCTLVFINQIRSKMSMYGNPNDTSGGKALKFYSTQRIEVKSPRKDDFIVDTDGDRIGHIVRYKIIKNKCAPHDIEGAFPLLYGNGIWRELEVIEMSIKLGLLNIGGRGGKQPLMPVLDDDNNVIDYTAYPKFRAAKFLMSCDKTYKFMYNTLKEVLDANEICNSDGDKDNEGD